MSDRSLASQPLPSLAPFSVLQQADPSQRPRYPVLLRGEQLQALAGGPSSDSTGTRTAAITVVPVNDAPLLDAARCPDLGTGQAGEATAVMTVATFPGGAASDVDSANLGVELLPAPAKVGYWQYSAGAGVIWTRVTNPTKLNASAFIQFVAAATAKTGPYGLSFEARDDAALSKSTGTATLTIA